MNLDDFKVQSYRVCACRDFFRSICVSGVGDPSLTFSKIGSEQSYTPSFTTVSYLLLLMAEVRVGENGMWDVLLLLWASSLLSNLGKWHDTTEFSRLLNGILKYILDIFITLLLF